MAKRACYSTALLESYPLYGPDAPKKGTDRVAPLLKLPPATKLCFISGVRDEFLNRTKSWRGTSEPISIKA